MFEAAATPEKVALDLLRTIAHLERRALHDMPPDGWESATREWVLGTYAECLAAVRAPADPDPRRGLLGRLRAARPPE